MVLQLFKVAENKKNKVANIHEITKNMRELQNSNYQHVIGT